MSTRLKSSRNSAGFTLVEVVVTIGLIGILAVISYPAVSSYIKNYNFRAAARDVLTAAMQTRSNAVRDNTYWAVSINPDDNEIKLNFVPDKDDRTKDIEKSVINISSGASGIKLIGAAETTCGNATSFDGVGIIQSTDFLFSPRGFITSTPTGSAIFLENSENKICYAVKATLAGSVSILRYDGTNPFSAAHWK